MKKLSDSKSNGSPLMPDIDLGPFAFGVLGLRPYDWQVRAFKGINNHQRTSLVAANGSGKTAAVIAPAILWWLTMFPKGRVPVTSGSWRQVLLQLWPAMEKYRGHPLFQGWTWNQAEIRTPQGGWASGFSTDNPGRAEGYHATDDSPVLYVLDEAKTIPDGIKAAVDRCTANRVLAASSPGAPMGWFYRSQHEEADYWFRVKARSDECPHIDPEKRQRDLEVYGEKHPIFRSMHLAEFAEDVDRLILSSDALRDAIDNPPDPHGETVVAFCDFAAGRDENVLAVRRGNSAKIVKAWAEKDTMQGVRQFIRLFESEELKASQIWGDADGLGTVMIDALTEHGWRINRFHGGARSREPNEYANLIGEVWHIGCREISRGRMILGDLDPVTFKQLTSRKTEWSENGKLRAESKDTMRASGLKSPDRADALLGCIVCGPAMQGMMTGEDPVRSRRSEFSSPRRSGFNAM
jgi:hypothetical protein